MNSREDNMKEKRPVNRVAGTATALMLAFGLLLSGATVSRAANPHDGDRRDNRKQETVSRPDHSGHSRQEVAFRTLPHGSRVIRAGKKDYVIHRGHFYRKEPRGYVAVSIPVGSVVASLPGGFLSVTIGGVNYWHADGVYIRRVSMGFAVVAPPVVQPVLPAGPAPLPSDVPSVAVDVPLLNVRSGPGLEFPVIAVVSQGQLLDIRGDSPGWYYIQGPDGSFGWVMDRLTRPVPLG
jgi:uncharacterized protein YgiM (DUF1202 family)